MEASNDGQDSSAAVSSGELFSVAFNRRDDLGGGRDEEDLGITRKTESLIPNRASIFDNLFALLSMGTFIADVAMDVVVAKKYYSRRHYWWFGLTLAFTLLPAVVMQVFSLRWYTEDKQKLSVSSVGLHVILLGPVERYLNAFYYGCKTYFKKKVNSLDYMRFLTEWRDITMLRLFEAFLESGPQVVLQLYVLASLNTFVAGEDWPTALAAASSVISLAWAIASYSHALRLCLAVKGLSYFGYFFQIWYRLSMVASRVVTLVLFASVFKEWIFLAVGVHFIAMFAWLSMEKSNFCKAGSHLAQQCLESGFNMVVAVIYIFCFLNIHEGATRHRIVAYYTIFLVENVTLIAFWFPNRTIHGSLLYAALGIVGGGYIIGVICLVFYYKYFHPNQDITAGWFPCQCCCKRKDQQKLPTEDESVITRAPKENAEKPKLKVRDIPRSLRLKIPTQSLRNTFLVTSPGTPIDIELPLRFGKSLNTPSKNVDVSGEEKPGFSGSTEVHEVKNRDTDKEVNNFLPILTQSENQPPVKSFFNLPLDGKSEGFSRSISSRSSVRETNQDYKMHPYRSKSALPYHSPRTTSSCEENMEPLMVVSYTLPISSTNSTISDTDEGRPLVNCTAKGKQRMRCDSCGGVSDPPLAITSYGTRAEMTHDKKSDRIDDGCYTWHSGSYHEGGVYGIDNPIVAEPYSPHPHKNMHSGDDYTIGKENHLTHREYSSLSGHSSDLEGTLEFPGKALTSERRGGFHRGRSKSLPDKHVVRQTVVDWMLDRLQQEHLKDLNERPHSDLGTYTVTLNIEGNDYYTSLV